MPANIEVYVEELVLHGFASGDRYRIAEAMERELSRLFTEQGVPPMLSKTGDVPHLDGGSFKFAQGTRAEKTGTQVGEAVYRGLRQ